MLWGTPKENLNELGRHEREMALAPPQTLRPQADLRQTSDTITSNPRAPETRRVCGARKLGLAPWPGWIGVVPACDDLPPERSLPPLDPVLALTQGILRAVQG